MKKILIGATIGLVLGAGGMCALAQLPDVADVVLKSDTTTSSTEINELKQENSALKTQIDTLNADLTTTKTQLSETQSALTFKEQEVSTLTAEKADLQSQLNTALEENEQYKQLIGEDNVDLLSIISSLTTQLNTKTEELNTATAELEQLRVDKETLTIRVSELETRLAEVEEELANYKSLENIDILNTANYDGTWYKDGTFADTYTITDGNVVHNQNEDTGYLVCMYNQMYLSMITGGYVPVTLSVDGNSFTTEDGTTYSKFYINTTTSTLPTYADFIGTYSHSTETITINGDNTISIVDGENTYYGAYIVTSTERNIGGNVKVTNYLTATINVGDSQEIRNFEIVSNSTEMIYNELSYTKIQIEPLYLNFGTLSTDNSIEITVKTAETIILRPNETANLCFLLNYVGSNSYSYFSVNGCSAINTSSRSVKYTNNTNNTIVGNKFKFLFNVPSSYSVSVQIYGISSFGGQSVVVESISSDSASKISLTSGLLEIYNNLQNSNSYNYVSCSDISDYTNGTYTLTDGTLELSSDGATITPTDSEAITATSYSVTAKTDGYDIYQTATITYVTTELVDDVETEVTHTIVIEYKNNNVISSTLDSVEIEIVKN